MKKIVTLLLMTTFLSGCSIFYPHKQDIEQGNVFTADDVSRLHNGMSQSQVREIMGDPVSIDIFNDNRLNYIYTMQRGHQNMTMKRVICVFEGGRLVGIQHN